MLWGDARSRLSELLTSQRGQLDLVLMDAFSPSRCPQLWTLEFLSGLGALLQPQGRLLTYCSAAAIRNALLQAGLQLASITAPSGLLKQTSDWSGGTAASPSPLDGDPQLRPLSLMEQEHLRTNAAEAYRDPSGCSDRAEILKQRQLAQARAMASGAVEGTGAWRRRWGVGNSRHQ
jgi:tRNA U34 5-methylaminomethyl-2-thiouridine-forming methyltransferase MnmC